MSFDVFTEVRCRLPLVMPLLRRTQSAKAMFVCIRPADPKLAADIAAAMKNDPGILAPEDDMTRTVCDACNDEGWIGAEQAKIDARRLCMLCSLCAAAIVKGRALETGSKGAIALINVHPDAPNSAPVVL